MLQEQLCSTSSLVVAVEGWLRYLWEGIRVQLDGTCVDCSHHIVNFSSSPTCSSGRM